MENIKREAKEIEKRLGEELELKEKGFIETKLSSVSASLIGKKIKFKAEIVGEKAGMAIPRYVHLICTRCSHILSKIDVLKNFRIFYKILRKEKVNVSDFKEIEHAECTSSQGHNLKIVFAEDEYVDASLLLIRDSEEPSQSRGSKALSEKTWKSFLLGIAPDYKRAEIAAVPFRNFKNNEIEFVVLEINPIEEEFEVVEINEEDHEKFKEYFCEDKLKEVVEKQIAPEIKQRSLAKESALLVLHSPREIVDPFTGKVMRGTLYALWFGDTGTGKSTIGEDLGSKFYKLAKYVIGESASRAGLTYTIDPEERMIEWGTLVLNDSKCVFIDGMHSLSSAEIAELREALSQQKVIVTRMVKGERPCRVRIIATLNPRSSMDSYVFKALALKDTALHEPDLRRFDIIISFSDKDVPSNVIAEAKADERPIPPEVFRRHVFWSWRLRAEQIRFTEKAKTAIIKYSREVLKWKLSELPVIADDAREKLLRLSAAYACLLHSVELEDGKEFVIVREDHVRKAFEFIMQMLENLEFFELYKEKAGKEELSDKEFEEIYGGLDEIHLQILEALKDGAKSASKLSTLLDISDRTVKEKFKLLKKFELIITSPGFGARLTRKGVKFLRKLKSKKVTLTSLPFTASPPEKDTSSQHEGNTKYEGSLLSGEVVKRGEVENTSEQVNSNEEYPQIIDLKPCKNCNRYFSADNEVCPYCNEKREN